MVLTAHGGLCIYCGRASADTLDHEQPFGSEGPDIWWNFVPACKPCNLWKNGRTARRWVADMDLKHSHPNVFPGRSMKPEVFAGIVPRVEKTQRELRDYARREWFRHHYGGQAKPKNKEDLLEWLAFCRKTLRRYPHAPWTTPAVEGYPRDVCTRRICCGSRHEDMRSMVISLSPDERDEFRRRAYQAGLHEGDLLGIIVRQHLSTLKN